MRSNLLLLAACSLVACAEKGESVDLTFADGTLHGLQYKKTEAYRGIPFAEPPVGALRWKPPVKNAAFTAPLDATESRDKCTQLDVGTTNLTAGSSEDCLYLNVFRPRTAGPHAVMLFFPGGAYVFDGNATVTYDGRKLAEAGDVIVVVANYRLGPFGFTAHPALSAEDATRPYSSNYGLDDQREAMRWVKRNIVDFGGDPERVTIFGESAGAGSACVHLLSAQSAGLFDSAILQSPPCTAFPFPTLAQSEAQGEDLAAAVGCTGDGAEALACLRAKSKEDIVRALPLHQYIIYGPGVAWGPVVDGVTLTDQPIKLLAQGKSANVPVIVDANSDEGELFFATNNSVVGETEIRALLSEMFEPAVIDAVIAHYPIATNGTPKETAVRILSDMFSCDARRIARAHSAKGSPTYHYFFPRKFYDIVLDLGAFHGADLAFVFGNSVLGLPVLPQGKPLKEAMQSYWSTFARTDDPNSAKTSVVWPRYDAQTDKSIQLDVPVSEQTNIRKVDCDFWDTQRAL